MSSVKAPLKSSDLSPHLSRLFKARKYSLCVADLMPLAEQGSIEARIALAHIYFYGGGGVSRDFVKAKRWLELIEDSDPTSYATYRLAIIYYKGLGVARNCATAHKLYRKAAIRGHMRSLLMVAADNMQAIDSSRKLRSAKIVFHYALRDRRLNLFARAAAFSWLCSLRWKMTKKWLKGSLHSPHIAP